MDLTLLQGEFKLMKLALHHLFYSSGNIHLFWTSDYMGKHFFKILNIQYVYRNALSLNYCQVY